MVNDGNGFDPLLLLKGSIIGVANIIPGVSGGTLAVVLGIYERFIEALSNILQDAENRKCYLKFLAHIGVGAFLSIFILSNLMDFLYENYEVPTIYFFMGLILGSIPTILKMHTDMRPNLSNIALFLIGSISILLLELLNVSEASASSGNGNLIFLFFVGIAAAAAMIVPGFSGSFVLVAFGVYWELIEAVKSFDLVVMAPPAIGGLIGVLGVSKIIGKVLSRYPTKFYYFILGLIIASLIVIFPGFPDGWEIIFSSVLTLAFGAIISSKLSK
ncbi:MAG: DUF368 domain-containing protein [Candidatus Methanofastidiosa archaeon]|nr:DUF368 domain-containing protein [Candidatus Methanofastidiosa archaeon]